MVFFGCSSEVKSASLDKALFEARNGVASAKLSPLLNQKTHLKSLPKNMPNKFQDFIVVPLWKM